MKIDDKKIKINETIRVKHWNILFKPGEEVVLKNYVFEVKDVQEKRLILIPAKR